MEEKKIVINIQELAKAVEGLGYKIVEFKCVHHETEGNTKNGIPLVELKLSK